MCVNAQCKPRDELLKMTAKCKPADCHGVGVCNNVGNCHCKAGYGGTDCSIPGLGMKHFFLSVVKNASANRYLFDLSSFHSGPFLGGSVNSGPAYGPSSINFILALFILFLLGTIVFGVFSVWYKRKRNVWPHRK